MSKVVLSNLVFKLNNVHVATSKFRAEEPLTVTNIDLLEEDLENENAAQSDSLIGYASTRAQVHISTPGEVDLSSIDPSKTYRVILEEVAE